MSDILLHPFVIFAILWVVVFAYILKKYKPKTRSETTEDSYVTAASVVAVCAVLDDYED